MATKRYFATAKNPLTEKSWAQDHDAMWDTEFSAIFCVCLAFFRFFVSVLVYRDVYSVFY
jgi:hypothetical protein